MSAVTSELLDPASSRPIGTNAWAIEQHPAAAGTPSISQAAAADPMRNVCKSLTVSIACGATAQTPIRAFLRDGASGAGTILWSGAFAAVAGAAFSISARGAWKGSPGVAMTLEFEGALAANVLGTVSMSGDLAVQ
jgi:hypothetical protein